MYDVVDDHLRVIGHDLLGVLLAGGTGEGELLALGLLVLGVVDVALIVHLPEYGLLPFFIVLLVVEGVVVGGQVGDADDGGALGHGEVLDVLAEVGLRGGLHAPAALAEVDGVEIPLHDLTLVVFLLELKGAEDLGELALDGDLVFAGEVLDELLGDGGAAVAGLHAGEHLHERARGAVPVHALMVIEALVLDGDEGFFHIPGDLVVIDPDALFPAGEIDELAPLARGVLIPDGTGLVELEVLKRQIEVRRQTGLDIVCEHAGKHHTRHEQDHQDGTDDLEHGSDGARCGVADEIHGPAEDVQAPAHMPHGGRRFAARRFLRFFRFLRFTILHGSSRHLLAAHTLLILSLYEIILYHIREETGRGNVNFFVPRPKQPLPGIVFRLCGILPVKKKGGGTSG